MRELTQLREMIEVNDERPWRIRGKASLHHHLVALQLPNPQTDVCTGVEEYLNEEEQKRWSPYFRHHARLYLSLMGKVFLSRYTSYFSLGIIQCFLNTSWWANQSTPIVMHILIILIVAVLFSSPSSRAGLCDPVDRKIAGLGRGPRWPVMIIRIFFTIRILLWWSFIWKHVMKEMINWYRQCFLQKMGVGVGGVGGVLLCTSLLRPYSATNWENIWLFLKSPNSILNSDLTRGVFLLEYLVWGREKGDDNAYRHRRCY